MSQETFEAVKNQMGPCGISCALCNLGNGTVAETAKKLKEYLGFYEVPSWAATAPGGSEIDFDDLNKNLDWMNTYLSCLGCERGGGPPDCVIRTCAKEKGLVLCSECSELEGCGKFDWLGESVKENLKNSMGKSKQELIQEAISKMKQ